MAHHAYFYAGDIEEGVRAAHAFGERELDLRGAGNPDLITLRYDLFPVEEARSVAEMAMRTPRQGDKKLIVVAASRIFHEAQNALLKTFEEPSAGTYIVLVVPSEGNIIRTLRSRLLPLPSDAKAGISVEAKEFLEEDEEGREKYVAKLLDRAKSDKQEEKQAARVAALRLAEGLMRTAHRKRGAKQDPDIDAFLSDLSRLIPILHERSAPLKPVLEHLLIVIPKGL